MIKNTTRGIITVKEGILVKKVLAIALSVIMIFSFTSVYAFSVKEAYKEFKSIHPEFVDSLIKEGIEEKTIISFMSDVYDYVVEVDSYTPITKQNFEENAMSAVMDVSSREKYYKLQDTLLILYPEAIKLAVTQGKVAPEFQPLVNTIKRIYFGEDNPGGGSSGGGGGGGSSEEDDQDDEEIKPEDNEPTTPPVHEISFTDIDSSHWAYTSVSYLASNFILNGYLDGTFKPENNITRAEFAKIIVSATDTFDSNAVSSFKDVSSDDWYYYYVSTAYNKGYITGYPDGSFRPNDKITRADICTIVNRVLKASPSKNPEAFKDDSEIPSYAKDSVYALSEKGIVNGFSNGTFAPKTYATRAQTAKIIYAAFFEK